MKGAAEQIENIGEIRDAILAGNAALGEAVLRGDAAAMAGLYTEDARLMPPNGGMLEGRDGIRAFWSDGIRAGLRELSLTTEDVIDLRDWACEIGRYDLTIRPEAGSEAKDHGKYVVLWKRTGTGAWKFHVDIWNTDQPAKY